MPSITLNFCFLNKYPLPGLCGGRPWTEHRGIPPSLLVGQPWTPRCSSWSLAGLRPGWRGLLGRSPHGRRSRHARVQRKTSAHWGSSRGHLYLERWRAQQKSTVINLEIGNNRSLRTWAFWNNRSEGRYNVSSGVHNRNKLRIFYGSCWLRNFNSLLPIEKIMSPGLGTPI